MELLYGNFFEGSFFHWSNSVLLLIISVAVWVRVLYPSSHKKASLHWPVNPLHGDARCAGTSRSPSALQPVSANLLLSVRKEGTQESKAADATEEKIIRKLSETCHDLRSEWRKTREDQGDTERLHFMHRYLNLTGHVHFTQRVGVLKKAFFHF